MARVNPTDTSPNLARRWYRWNGAEGRVEFWDKAAKNEDGSTGGTFYEDAPVTFLMLYETSTITGFNKPAAAGIGANEVRDTRQDAMLVRLWDKGRTLVAEGTYQSIKDRVKAMGGSFTVNCYAATKDTEGKLQVVVFQWKRSALSAWMDFRRTHRKDIYSSAVVITGAEEKSNGGITFKVPVFKLKPVSAETDALAEKLQHEVMAYFEEYFGRPRAARGEEPQADAPTGEPEYQEPPGPGAPEPEADDVPF